MNRYHGKAIKVILRGAAIFGLLLTVLICSVLAETSSKSALNESGASEELSSSEGELELNFRFLTSMLELLNLNLHLINTTLGERVSDYPFLAPAMNGTGSGMESVNAILAVMGSGSQELNESETNITTGSIKESFQQLNSSLEPPEAMLEAANSTMGEANQSTPLITEMYKSIKSMLSLFS